MISPSIMLLQWFMVIQGCSNALLETLSYR